MKKPAPVFIIWGITGDLSRRKLLPALYHLFCQELLSPESRVIGISRRELDLDGLLAGLEATVSQSEDGYDAAGLGRLRRALQGFKLEPETDADYAGLAKLLDHLDTGGRRERLFYMSIPSRAYAPIVARLGSHGLNDARSRLLLEKPFGYDLASAQALIKTVDQVFSEEQVYRIDHYLAKETAQNLLTFRLHNPIFVPLWNAEHIKRVHILAAETLTVEGRANFYEQTGALRDFVQSHLMQLLAIVLMEVPAELDSQSIHARKQQFMEQLLPADPKLSVRGQYAGYRNEVGNPDSTVETYAKVTLGHGAERWRDTELVLETGKALDRRVTEITVEFKTPHERRHNRLIFRLQPDEGIELELVVKEPGFENRMRHARLDFRYDQTFGRGQHIEAYERVLMDAVRGDQSLFASDRDVLETWRVLQPLLDAWQGGRGLLQYAGGSKGPA